MQKILTKLKIEPTIFLFGKMWRFARGHRGKVVVFLILSLAANLLMLTVPWIVSRFFNELQYNGFGEHNFWKLLGIIGAVIVVQILAWGLHAPSRILERTAAFWTEYNYTRYLFDGVLNLDFGWHASRQSGEIIDKINNARQNLRSFAENIFQILDIGVRIVGTVIVLIFFDWRLAAAVLLMVVLAWVVVYGFDRRLVPMHHRLNEFGNRIGARIFDALSNKTTIKILHIETPVKQAVAEALREPWPLWRRNFRLNEVKWATASLLFQMVVILPIVVYLTIALRDDRTVDVGTVSALYLYLSNLIGAFHRFAWLYEDLFIKKTKVQNAASLEKFFAARQMKRRRISDWQVLEIRNLKFTYPDKQNRQESDLTIEKFKLRKGEKVALVGASGGGKTTFLKVLHGLYRSASADFRVDGSVPRRVDFADIDLQTMLVPQEPEIFVATILDNITMGLDFPPEEISTVIKSARFDEVVEKLPRGLYSKINEKGVNLSGGQKQRLALSRALLFARDKRILLLDESTSSVDAVNEMTIYRHIFAQFPEQTIIASVHKLNLLEFFDRIVVFKNGRIADSGTLDELLTRNTDFCRSWEEYRVRDE